MYKRILNRINRKSIRMNKIEVADRIAKKFVNFNSRSDLR